MPANRVPSLVKHMTVAIYNKGGIDGGTKKERFISAWKIARSRLTDYGFLVEGSQEGKSSNIKLTSKGRQRESYHAREGDAAIKDAAFDKMYKWIEDTEIGDGGEVL